MMQVWLEHDSDWIYPDGPTGNLHDVCFNQFVLNEPVFILLFRYHNRTFAISIIKATRFSVISKRATMLMTMDSLYTSLLNIVRHCVFYQTGFFIYRCLSLLVIR